MNIAEPFIKRPIATTLIMTGVVIFGALGYRQLPVSDLPTIDYPTINVNANLPGANPEIMAAAVATPLERAFSSVPGIEQITSSSSQGSTNITLQFSLSRSIDAAAQDVQTAISRASRGLPDDMRDPPNYNKSNPSDQPIVYFSVASRTPPLSTVNEYAETMIAQRLSTIEGVAQVNLMGEQRYAVRVQLDPRALAYRRIGLDEVVTAVNANNINSPAGAVWGRSKVRTEAVGGRGVEAGRVAHPRVRRAAAEGRDGRAGARLRRRVAAPVRGVLRRARHHARRRRRRRDDGVREGDD